VAREQQAPNFQTILATGIKGGLKLWRMSESVVISQTVGEMGK
jgi:hypothetical protein